MLARLGVSRDDGKVLTHIWIQRSQIHVCKGQEEAVNLSIQALDGVGDAAGFSAVLCMC